MTIIEKFKSNDLHIVKLSYRVNMGFASLLFKFKEVNGKIVCL